MKHLFVKFLNKRNLMRAIPVIVGAVVGYAYYRFVGCRTGSCPITSSPFASTLYGGLVGLLLTNLKEK